MNTTDRIKFLYSYGGTILPRRTDGKLCYVGGYTRVLAVDRSITFTELMVKFGELCECSMSLRCKLPSEDLDLLVSTTCDEDLAAIIEEYDRASSEVKIRAILVPLKSLKRISPPSSVSSFNFFSSKSFPPAVHRRTAAKAYTYGVRSVSPIVGFPVSFQKDNNGRALSYLSEQGRDRLYLVRHGNHWELNNLQL